MQKSKLLSLILILTMVFSLVACTDYQSVSDDILSQEEKPLYSETKTLSNNTSPSESSSPDIGAGTGVHNVSKRK